MSPFLLVFCITVTVKFENYGSDVLRKPDQDAKFWRGSES